MKSKAGPNVRETIWCIRPVLVAFLVGMRTLREGVTNGVSRSVQRCVRRKYLRGRGSPATSRLRLVLLETRFLGASQIVSRVSVDNSRYRGWWIGRWNLASSAMPQIDSSDQICHYIDDFGCRGVLEDEKYCSKEGLVCCVQVRVGDLDDRRDTRQRTRLVGLERWGGVSACEVFERNVRCAVMAGLSRTKAASRWRRERT